MAGQNKLVKENTVLFKAGDAADRMYIIRKGTLKVFLQKGAEEIPLATLNEGSIVGEMAFFDDKPRSAGVRSLSACELTVISRQDFDKLFTQVPKWMVTMLQSLSGRLRTTNERLQKLEQAQSAGGAPVAGILPNQTHAYQRTLRILRVILLALAKDGQKEGRELFLEASKAKQLVSELFPEDLENYEKIVKVLSQIQFLNLKLDATKVPVMPFLNRGVLVNFIEYFSQLAPKFPASKPTVSSEALALFQACIDLTTASGFEVQKLNLAEVIQSQLDKGTDVKGWKGKAAELALIPETKLTADKGSHTITINLKVHKLLHGYFRHINTFYNSNLA